MPNNLPSTFIYAGSDLSWFSVEYYVDFKFLGLTQTQFGVPNAEILQQRSQMVLVRALEPPVKPAVEKEVSCKLKGTLGGNKGECLFKANLPCDVTMQNSPLKVELTID